MDMILDFLDIGIDLWGTDIGILLMGIGTCSILIALIKRLITGNY